MSGPSRNPQRAVLVGRHQGTTGQGALGNLLGAAAAGAGTPLWQRACTHTEERGRFQMRPRDRCSRRAAPEEASGACGRLARAPGLRAACTPRSVVAPDLDHGGRGIPHDLVLDRHRREPALATRRILRRRRAAGFQDTEIREGVILAIVPL